MAAAGQTLIPVSSGFTKYPTVNFPDNWSDDTKFTFAERITLIHLKLSKIPCPSELSIGDDGYLERTIAGKIPDTWGIAEENVQVGWKSRRFYFVGDEIIYQPNPKMPFWWACFKLNGDNLRHTCFVVDNNHLELILRDLHKLKN